MPDLSQHTQALNPVFSADSHEGHPVDGLEEPTPCVQRWVNLADESTKKRLGIFQKTGLFLSVCRHGMALVMCDMVQSGEL
jgi:Kyakuja-Dileera-Zisupton transposase